MNLFQPVGPRSFPRYLAIAEELVKLVRAVILRRLPALTPSNELAIVAHVLEFIYFLASEAGITFSQEPDQVYLREHCDEMQRLVAQATPDALRRHRRWVLMQNLTEQTQEQKLLAVASLYAMLVDQGVMRSDPSGYRGSVPAIEQLRRRLQKKNVKRYPKIPSIERYAVRPGVGRRTHKREHMFASTFGHWLCLLRNIPYEQEFVDEIGAALASVTRDELILYRCYLRRPRCTGNAILRQERLSTTMKFLRWLTPERSQLVCVNIPSVHGEDSPKARRPALPLVERFLSSLQTKDAALVAYRSTLWVYLEWLVERTKSPLFAAPLEAVISEFEEAITGATVETLEEFRAYLQRADTPGDPTSKVKVFALLKRFYAWVAKDLALSTSPMERLTLGIADIARPEDRERKPRTPGTTGPRTRPTLNLLDRFLEGRQLTDNSRRDYANHLWTFFWWLADTRGIPLRAGAPPRVTKAFEDAVRSCTRADLESFRNHLLTADLRSSPTTRCYTFKITKIFLRRLHKLELMASDVTRGVPDLKNELFSAAA